MPKPFEPRNLTELVHELGETLKIENAWREIMNLPPTEQPKAREDISTTVKQRRARFLCIGNTSEH